MARHKIELFRRKDKLQGFILRTGDRELVINSDAELLAIYRRLVDYEENRDIDGVIAAEDAPLYSDYIRTVEAKALAKDLGFDVPQTRAITHGCERGTIPGARKPSTRWEMPREEFLKWLRAWAAKREK